MEWLTAFTHDLQLSAPALWHGLSITLKVVCIATIGGIFIGTLLALMRLSSIRVLNLIAQGYVNLFRSIPLLLVLMWFYFAVPFIYTTVTGSYLTIDTALVSSIVAFMLFEAAYFSEIVRAGIQSIPKGQSAAAYALGMTYGHHLIPRLDHGVRHWPTRLFPHQLRAGRFDVSINAIYFICRPSVFHHQYASHICSKTITKEVKRMSDQKVMIDLQNVSKWYGDFQVLTDCTTQICQGEVVVVCGPSGSGKSTLIKTVNGLEAFQQGQITVDGIPIKDPKTDLTKLRSRVGMVFQHFELFPHLSITENLTIAQIKVLGRSEAEAKKKGLGYLERVGLSAHAHKFPAQLSGGQQQRVAIARALSMDPIAMLFDEPTSALDPEMINEVLDVMVELAHEGMTMMCVTHEMGFARQVANRVLFMDQGKIVEDCSKDDFFNTKRGDRAQQFLDKILH